MTLPASAIRAALALVVVVAAACAGGDADAHDAAGAGAPATTTAPTTTAAPATPAEAISWTGSFAIDLANGWTITGCEGDRTDICFWDGEELLGDTELVGTFPLAADDPPDPEAAARRWATDMVDHFRTDRSEGCSAFAYEGDEVATVTVAGRPGARSGFTLTDGDGRVVERVVNHYVLTADGMAIIGTDAYVAEGGCLPPSEVDASFRPEHLAVLEPQLDGLVASAPLP